MTPNSGVAPGLTTTATTSGRPSRSTSMTTQGGQKPKSLSSLTVYPPTRSTDGSSSLRPGSPRSAFSRSGGNVGWSTAIALRRKKSKYFISASQGGAVHARRPAVPLPFYRPFAGLPSTSSALWRPHSRTGSRCLSGDHIAFGVLGIIQRLTPDTNRREHWRRGQKGGQNPSSELSPSHVLPLVARISVRERRRRRICRLRKCSLTAACPTFRDAATRV